jgi:large subunit ribosomal protein L4
MLGAAVGEIELSDATFGAEIHGPSIHLVVRSQLNAKRQGTQSTLTRTEVRGGGRKMYRQKGTGNARHHARRAPQFVHGGVAFAPKPRDYSFSVPRKVKRLAMLGALTSKVADGDIIVLDELAFSEAKTRAAVKMLKALGVDKKALIVLAARDDTASRAVNNIPGVKCAYVNTLNVLDIIGYDKFIVTRDSVRQVEEVYN